MNYTAAQQKAINTIDKNLQIIACAGSGKTQVISMRIVRIIQSGVNPSKIIAFTYTEKAAAELKTRVLKLVKEEIGEVAGLSEMYIGTIHSWCLQILQDLLFQYQKFSILDDLKLKLFVDKNFKKIGMKDLNMRRFVDTGLFIGALSVFRESRIVDGYEVPDELLQALDKYESTLEDAAYFDFTMIMTKALDHLLNDDLFRERIQNNIGYLIVDEYQDINPIQEDIINQIYKLGANICTVGDDDQTLYQWRGSDINLIQDFKKRYDDVEYISLEDNFRSTNGIVDVALKSITNNVDRLPKGMNAAGHQESEVGDILYNQYEDVEEEYAFIASTINSLRGVTFQDKGNSKSRGLDYSDFTILLRRWREAERITEVLEEHNIPYIVKGVNNLFQTNEINAAYSLFKFLDEQIDEDVLISAWLSVHEKIDKKKVQDGVEYLKNKIPKRDAYYESFIIQDVYMKFLEKAGIREEIFNDGQGENSSGYLNKEVVFYNLGMFSQIINDFETIYFKSDPKYKLNTFLNFLRYSGEENYAEGWLNNTYRTPNAVQIMTIHQSKGLEFPVVFIPGLNRNYLPMKRPGGKQVWHYIDINMIEDGARYKGNVEDERRLMYVAITRSQKFLFASRAPVIGNRLYQKESKFGREIRLSEYYTQSKGRTFEEREMSAPKPLDEISAIALNFSRLKDFFDCPYAFKFYSFYGFVQPLGARMGYGNTMHNALMEMHRKALEGEELSKKDIPELLDVHAHFPNALNTLEAEMTKQAAKSLEVYLDRNAEDFDSIEYAEKDIHLDLGDGVLVDGRMDLIKKRQLDGTYQTTIIDFKSTSDTQAYQATIDQLQLYALGYKEISGEKADFLEIYNLDENIPNREELKVNDLEEIKTKIKEAADHIRGNQLEHTCNDPDCVCRYKNI